MLAEVSVEEIMCDVDSLKTEVCMQSFLFSFL